MEAASARVSLANLTQANYAATGDCTRRILEELFEDFQAQGGEMARRGAYPMDKRKRNWILIAIAVAFMLVYGASIRDSGLSLWGYPGQESD